MSIEQMQNILNEKFGDKWIVCYLQYLNDDGDFNNAIIKTYNKFIYG